MANFLSDYMLYNSGNECPPNYHIWSAFTVIASAVGPKVWFEMGYINIYLNPYVLLVGEQGNGKTVAKDIAYDMLKRACPTLPMSAECTSKESIVQHMSEDDQARQYKPSDEKGVDPVEYRPFTIYITELKNFVSVNPTGMLDFLTTIYDRTGKEYSSKYRNQGEFVLVSPYVVFLACETPEWLTYRLKESVISGGFSRRCFFVYEITDSCFNKTMFINDEMRAALARCIRHLESLRGVIGAFTFGPGAEAYFNKWKESRRLPPDTIIRGYVRSKHIQVIKIASALALCEYPASLIVTRDHIEMALDLLQRLEPNMFRLFQGVGQNPLIHATTLALNIVDSLGGMVKEKDVKVAMWNAARDVDYSQIRTHLRDSGKLVFATKKENGMDISYIMTIAKAEELKTKGQVI